MAQKTCAGAVGAEAARQSGARLAVDGVAAVVQVGDDGEERVAFLRGSNSVGYAAS